MKAPKPETHRAKAYAACWRDEAYKAFNKDIGFPTTTRHMTKVLRALVRDAVKESNKWALSCRGDDLADSIAKQLIPK